MTVTAEEMRSLVGWRFPGGTFTIEHWENLLLHDVTLDDPPTADLAHVIYAFHAPLAAMGLSYAEFFNVCHAESADAVRAGEYDFEYVAPLREGIAYDVTGEIIGVERKRGRRAGVFDAVTFTLEMRHGGSLVARATNSWLFLRSET